MNINQEIKNVIQDAGWMSSRMVAQHIPAFEGDIGHTIGKRLHGMWYSGWCDKKQINGVMHYRLRDDIEDEGLKHKIQIAAELAVRDKKIDDLKMQLRKRIENES